MKSIRSLAAFAALATAAMLLAGPASAQATRTWVSGVGDDANPCSRTAPCKTFAGAISRTAAAGEIDCLDPGGFGAVTITKAITIDCESVSNGGVLVSGTNGIVVAAGPSDDVQLIGLDIDGLGPGAASLNGVDMTSAGALSIINCLIYGFQNGAAGTGSGVFVGGPAGAHVLLSDTVIRDNTNGVVVYASGATTNTVTIDHSVIDGSLSSNVLLVNPGAVVVLNASSLFAAPNAIANVGGGLVTSFGNNAIRGAGTPGIITPLQ